MIQTILYVSLLFTDEISEIYGISDYSLAGNNKKKSIIRSIAQKDTEVHVVSPVFKTTESNLYCASQSYFDEDIGAHIHIPPIVDLHPVFNYISTTIISTIYIIHLHMRINFDSVIFYNFQLITALPSFILSKFMNTNLVVQFEDAVYYDTESGYLLRISSMLLRKLLNRSLDGAICVNTNLEELIYTDNTVVVRGFPSINTDIMDNYNGCTDTITVMFAGRLDELRGIDLFLSSIKCIDEDNIQFWISGYGPRTDEIKEYIDRLNDDRVSFFGTLPEDEYRKKLVTADIFVNFQKQDEKISYYTFPSKLLDYMACEGVILSTNMSDLEKEMNDLVILEDEEYIVDRLSEMVQKYSRSDNPYDQQIQRAKNWVMFDCTLERQGNKVQTMLADT
ncbi:glycosyltransferase [Halorubrum aethiopicum]|uniref:glycosyltransferase n=1 Tax=Halorubrum aethiopicum TaxID=1758255 RepID=UPI0009B5ADEC|nr:glycosyltransferase [Halorubrum aethiopicum]